MGDMVELSMKICKKGHRYPALLSECPECVLFSGGMTQAEDFTGLNFFGDSQSDFSADYSFEGSQRIAEQKLCKGNEAQQTEWKMVRAFGCLSCNLCYDRERYDKCPRCGSTRGVTINAIPENEVFR